MRRSSHLGSWAVLGAFILLTGLSAQPLIASNPGAVAIIARYDRNHDKALDLSEVKAAAASHFAALDSKGDGKLTASEVSGVIPQSEFKAADTNNDGRISKKEYLALAEKLFREANPDDDGTLEAKELESKAGRRLVALMGG